MKRAVIVHGFVGVPDDAWKPWLRTELEALGFATSAPHMPDPASPHAGRWVDELKKVVGTPDEHCFLIGHSLGSAAILRYLESLPESSKVGGAIFISGFTSLILPEFASFFDEPFDWQAIRSRCPRFVAIYSDNDPVVPLEASTVFRERLGARIIIERGQGHFGEEDGVSRIDSVVDAVVTMSTSLGSSGQQTAIDNERSPRDE